MNLTYAERQRAKVLNRALVFGIASSVVFLAVGLLLWVVLGPGRVAEYTIDVGLLLLMATPIARVLRTWVDDIGARDWRSLAATSAVLAIIATTVIVAALG